MPTSPRSRRLQPARTRVKPAPSAKVCAAGTVNVLFIGNSFTARNNLPGLIARLAAARGRTMEWRLINRGGASLRMHWNAGEAQQAIEGGKYDFVVLQEQSTLPVKNAVRMHENVRLFAEVIPASGAKMVLYQTWARQHQPEAQAVLSEAYESIGRELGAVVVPVGRAWQQLLTQPGHPVLHDKDRSHPTLAGSYLAACVFYGVLFGESPVGIEMSVVGLEPKDVAQLQKAAWTACRAK